MTNTIYFDTIVRDGDSTSSSSSVSDSSLVAGDQVGHVIDVHHNQQNSSLLEKRKKKGHPLPRPLLPPQFGFASHISRVSTSFSSCCYHFPTANYQRYNQYGTRGWTREGRTRKNMRKTKPGTMHERDDVISENSLQFDLDTIIAATNDFSDANKLGQGGFGAVYKGELFEGQKIAVKRLSKGSQQGLEEFKNEVNLLPKLQHRNLVRLLGFCLAGEEKLLIYEFVPNLSLDKYIFDKNKRSLLDWEMRYKIIGGIARGLLYLHEDSRLRIIHRDLKSGNILLDVQMNAKIADFGIAKLFYVDQTRGKTARPAGTFGYMAPEYVRGFFSAKSDVYSFGVLLLEIISGQKTIECRRGYSRDLLSYTWKLWRDGNTLQLMDPTLMDNHSANEVMRCIHIALLCVQDDPNKRPTMSSVVLMLNRYSVILETPCEPALLLDTITGEDDLTLSSPSTPAFFVNSQDTGESGVQSVKAHSVNDVSITELHLCVMNTWYAETG